MQKKGDILDKVGRKGVTEEWMLEWRPQEGMLERKWPTTYFHDESHYKPVYLSPECISYLRLNITTCIIETFSELSKNLLLEIINMLNNKCKKSIICTCYLTEWKAI